MRQNSATGSSSAREGEDSYKVWVSEPPVGGRANEAVLELLAETLALPRESVTLVSGGASRDKIVELAGIPPDEIERRLATAGGLEQE